MSNFIINPYSFVSNWLLNNLISYWKADTNWSFPDAHWSNNWTINGATYTASWKINWAYDLDWINDNITVANNANLDLWTWDFTINFWFNATSLADNDNFISDYTTANRWWYIHINSANQAVRLVTYDWVWITNVASADSYLSTWVWTMLTCIRSWTNHYIYKNWWSEVSASWTSRNLSNAQFEIWTLEGSNFYDWDIDEIWIWNTAITADQLAALYNSWDGLSYNSYTN